MKALKAAILAGVVVTTAILSFSLGRKTAKSEPITQIDTIYHYDTITALKPIYFNRYITDTILVPADTIRRCDTLYIELPVEVKEYRDTNYYARVSGYRAELDYIETYNKMTIVEKVVQDEGSIWGVGLSAGYAVGRNGLTPYIGIGINANISQKKIKKICRFKK